MSRINMEVLPGACAPVLSAALLARIYELNLDYVELLIAEHASAALAAQLQHLPDKVRSGLAALPVRARSLLTSTPYTIYSLGFEDDGFWRAACEPVVEPVELRYAPAGTLWLQGPFCEAALLHAWHVASSHPLAARILYAMPDATAKRLAATPLWQIRRIANDYPALLMPRWPTNPCFWSDLVQFATAEDEPRLATARLLGSQLIAAELESVGATTRSVRSPRLRARKLRFEGRSR